MNRPDGITLSKAAGFAIHQALYEALKLLDTKDSPFGIHGDAARRALRRAWVATHSLDGEKVEQKFGLTPFIFEPEVERAMFYHWAEREARSIDQSDPLTSEFVGGPKNPRSEHAGV